MQQMTSLIARMGTVMDGMVKQHPEMMDTISQEDKAALTSMMQEASQYAPQAQGNPAQLNK
jgi:hypothetical protein